MSMIKELWKKYGINPFDALLKKAQKQGSYRFLICWNRGLGDIPLGLYALTHRIFHYLPHAQITFVTRSDLADGFKLLRGVNVVVDPTWERGVSFDLDQTFLNTSLKRADFDVILEKPDPTSWLMWQLGSLVPKLRWDFSWDALCEKFALDKKLEYIGVHVQTETSYTYEKNWPLESWREFFNLAQEEYGFGIVLFGFGKEPMFDGKSIVDLRGKTSLLEMLSMIKNRCRYLVVPDSGVLSMTYYIDAAFPLDIISLWADPKQGVLKQNVASPNSLLRHHPLIAQNKDLRSVKVNDVLDSLHHAKGGAYAK